MKILHVLLTRMPIPPKDYGGTERVLWALYKGQTELGHEVRFLTKANPSNVPYIQVYDKSKPIEAQIDDWADIVHFHWPYDGDLHKPYICTEHSNAEYTKEYPINSVFLSSKHAENHGARCYVHNGLYWGDYGDPNFKPKNYVHFLAKAAWYVKNLQGAVKVARAAHVHLEVLGGKRISIRRNPYFYISRDVNFNGMVGGERKNQLVRNSKGLIFPVLWHEPFGLAIIESMYLGCPVFASPFGSLPDIVSHDGLGILSDSYSDLAEAVKQIDKYDRRLCHEHAKTHFGHQAMSKAYLECYERVMAGESLNEFRPICKGNVKAQLSMRY